MWWLPPKTISKYPFLIRAFQGDVQAAWRTALPACRLQRFVSLHSCRLCDPSQLWLWNVSRDVASLSYSSIDVPARHLAQVKTYHLKISLLFLSLPTDPPFLYKKVHRSLSWEMFDWLQSQCICWIGAKLLLLVTASWTYTVVDFWVEKNLAKHKK